MTNFSQIKRHRDTDPTYIVNDAISEYLKGHLDEAKDIAHQYWAEKCPEEEPFDQEFALEHIIGHMSPEDAYWMGVFSEKLNDYDLFCLNGYGHFEAIGDEGEYALETIMECAVDGIIGGDYEISDELQAIVDLFDDDDDDDYRSNNRKSASKKKPTSKGNTKKTPAKSQCVKRPGTSKGNTKRPSQSNNRKPRTTSGKKPAPRRR